MDYKTLKHSPQQRELLEKRFAINRAIREFFWGENFLEVETPLLVRSPGQEPYLQPFETKIKDGWGKEYNGFLITSPEYAMKKLLVAGFSKIFHLSKVFRNNEEFGGTHNPEFTMIEWYRAGEGYKKLCDDVENLTRFVAQKIGNTTFVNVTFTRISMKQLWEKYVRVNLDEYLTKETMHALAIQKGYPVKESEEYEDAFFRIFLNEIEPHLTEPTCVYEYPKNLASLARVCAHDDRYVERMEAYIGGNELGNGFGELTDAVEQRQRLEEEQALRKKIGNTFLPIDAEFIESLQEGMPPSSGIALGVDRLAMALLNANNINELLPFSAKNLFGQDLTK